MEIIRYKANKTCTGFVCRKLQNVDKRNQRLNRWRDMPCS